ncbi:MAG: MOSC domain-containing protein [Zoogloeaceae bacterium]|jgi:MOSC domain-containing protein YiiM|nr:MOSC domain-containing protein [Zoogloeaceae bacterium]
MTRIDAVYTGGIRPLPPEGHPSGIFKQKAAGPVWLGAEGLDGDAQADRRVHGGPWKALHHYATENYARLAAAFPDKAALFVPGSFGENVSTTGWDEDAVCVGDVFRIGTATVQVSQPRQPCWKLNHKFGEDGLMRHIAEHCLAGWYYRVLENGPIAADDSFELIERNARPVTLRHLWFAFQTHRPDPAVLAQLRDIPGLSPNWVDKLNQRIAWLKTEIR